MAVDSTYPTGTIPLVESYQAHRTFLSTVEPAIILFKLNDVRRLLRRDETAASVVPDATTVITTSTIRDEQLRLISWEQELEYVTAFGSDFHIPSDYPTYVDQPVEQRVVNVLKYLLGTILFQHRCQALGHSTRVLPLIKGVTWAKRAICHTALEALGFEYGVYYGIQYFTGATSATVALVARVHSRA